MLSRQWGDDESTNLVKQFTFTIGLDDLAILVRVNPVFPVSHLVPFTRFNLTTGFRRKFFDGSEENYVRKKRILCKKFTPSYSSIPPDATG